MTILRKAIKIEVMDGLMISVYFENNEKRILDVRPYCTGKIFKDFKKMKSCSKLLV